MKVHLKILQKLEDKIVVQNGTALKFYLSLIIDGATEKVFKLLVALKSESNVNVCLSHQKCISPTPKKVKLILNLSNYIVFVIKI
jgi:hypothetical protein